LPSPTADEKLPVGTGSNPVSDKAFIFKLSLQPCFSCVFVEMLKVTFEK
jgi:hypothetical protein